MTENTEKANMESPSVPRNCRQLVVNWHFTEACNYRCSFCYAHWDTSNTGTDLMRDDQSCQQLLCRLFDFFQFGNPENPICQEMQWETVRLNIAGGEPLLNQKRTIEIAKMAQIIGFDVSLITNGSRLDSETAAAISPALSMIGVSVDSGCESTNRRIGRVDRNGRVLRTDDLSLATAAARLANPDIRLKINTVVNALNFDADMTTLIRSLNPYKWKVLQMLPSLTDNLAVTDSQFRNFVSRHQSLEDIMSVEDNDSMTESYIMIDPKGRFYQDNTGGDKRGYQYSRPILDVGVRQAFADVNLHSKKFLSRYKDYSPREATPSHV